jgi:pyridine nucleotide-disulfide oxidoreductase family protein
MLVSPARHTPYSGMLPGHIAGRYSFDDIHIDLAALCERCGVKFRIGTATHVDADAQVVALADGAALPYAMLSLDIGSTPSVPGTGGIAVKPIATFAERLKELDAAVASGRAARRIAVVGTGVAGVEIAFALRHRYSTYPVTIVLVGRGAVIMPERSPYARRLASAALRQAGIETQVGFDACAFEQNQLHARDGATLPADFCIWTTSSAAPSWLLASGLSLDDAGFVRVDQFLRSPSHPTVLAAGDVAALHGPRPKAGVFAVRAGPVLADNLIALATGGTLTPFRPQRAWLALISLGDGRTIADKWGFAVAGRWVTAWKHWNDTSFLRRYQVAATQSPSGVQVSPPL